jgi:hypothetical protein
MFIINSWIEILLLSWILMDADLSMFGFGVYKENCELPTPRFILKLVITAT